jgi:hypothetical protein
MLKRAIFVGFAIAFSCLAQQRFPSGEFKGFTKSPTEHVISGVDEPFTVSSVRGMIVLKGQGDPLRDVTLKSAARELQSVSELRSLTMTAD